MRHDQKENIMRRLLLPLLAATSFMAAPALAQQPPASIAAVPENDGYAFLEAPEDHTVGSNTAPNTLIIYASITCPHCSHWFTEEWDLLKSELIDTGDLRVVFREFLTAPARASATGFTIANCAPSEKYMDVIYHQMVNQSTILESLQAGSGIAAYTSTLEVAGLTEDALPECFATQSHFERLGKASERGAAGGIAGVPGFILNGKLYKGQAKADELSKLFASGVSTP